MTYVFLLIGFILLTVAADWLIDGASGLAKRLNISDLIIGLTIVAFGTSAPELVVNIVASFSGSSDIAMTNILGSNIINTMIILGTSAVIYPVACKPSTFKFEIPLSGLGGIIIILLSTNLFGLFAGNATNHELSRIDGIILLLIFAAFCTYTIYQGIRNKTNAQDTNVATMPIWKSILLIAVGLTGLIIGGQLIVQNAILIATSWGISEAVIGVTVVALGTSLPELATSAMAAIKKNTDLAIGNVIGSNIFNVFFILGLSATIHPLECYSNFIIDSIMAAASSFILLIFIGTNKDRQIKRWAGIILLLAYAAYLIWLLSTIN